MQKSKKNMTKKGAYIADGSEDIKAINCKLNKQRMMYKKGIAYPTETFVVLSVFKER